MRHRMSTKHGEIPWRGFMARLQSTGGAEAIQKLYACERRKAMGGQDGEGGCQTRAEAIRKATNHTKAQARKRKAAAEQRP